MFISCLIGYLSEGGKSWPNIEKQQKTNYKLHKQFIYFSPAVLVILSDIKIDTNVNKIIHLNVYPTLSID